VKILKVEVTFAVKIDFKTGDLIAVKQTGDVKKR
jgi:hypothetical protein